MRIGLEGLLGMTGDGAGRDGPAVGADTNEARAPLLTVVGGQRGGMH